MPDPTIVAYTHIPAVGEFCSHCFGNHAPDISECSVEWKGRRFKPPFLCLCCGKETCMRQFAYGRACGPCDTGSCNAANRAHVPQNAHPRFNATAYTEQQEKVDA